MTSPRIFSALAALVVAGTLSTPIGADETPPPPARASFS